MSATSTKSEKQVEEIIDKCSEMIENDENPFFGMSYIDGVKAALDWAFNEGSDPLE